MKPYLQSLDGDTFNLNNIKTTIAAPLSDASETLEVSDPINFPSLEKPAHQGWTRGFPLTLSDGTNSEIVYVTEVTNGTTLTIVRGQEETAPRAFAAGASGECRLTAGTLAALSNQCENAYEGGVVIGEYAEANQDWWGSIVIGHSAKLSNTDNPLGASVVIGSYAESSASETVAVGEYATIGRVSVFDELEESPESVGVGVYATITGPSPESVAIGANAGCGGRDLPSPQSIAIGSSARAKNSGSIAIGAHAEADAANSIALGDVTANVEGGMAVAALPYIPASAGAKSMQTVIATSVIDLSSGTASATLDMPANSIMLIDSLDWITTASDTPGGTPEIQIGTDATNNNTLLAASEITATGLHQRQTFEPLHSNGVTSVHVSVVTAGTGTLTGKLVVRGYVMEV